MFMKLYEETILRSVFISLPLGNVDDGSRSFECVAMFNKCRSFFCARLSTNTSCKCTRVTRCKSEVQDSYPEKRRVSTEKSDRAFRIDNFDNFLLFLKKYFYTFIDVSITSITFCHFLNKILLHFYRCIDNFNNFFYFFFWLSKLSMNQ